MSKEILYSKSTDQQHIKLFGQYFTDYDIADFMVRWACNGAENMLDPAVGNSVFFNFTQKYFPDCSMTGYEIDPTILDYFGNPANANIIVDDYLKSDWEMHYEAIVCNPPYQKFQSIPNRSEILQDFYCHTDTRFSGYTNLYTLFLIKSIYQLSPSGRLAYIIPTEFLNSAYGTQVKELIIKKRLLKAIINFQNNADIFYNATTTCCILLLDYTPKDYAHFYNLSSVDELKTLSLDDISSANMNRVNYNDLLSNEKWRAHLNQEPDMPFENLRNISDFCSVSRGIATGANSFFCLTQSQLNHFGIPENCVRRCICHSADVKSPIFTEDVWVSLAQSDKVVYLLDVDADHATPISKYLDYGITRGVDKKYLPSRRKQWFSMEQKPAAPILISSACRNKIKVVRNLAQVKSLTTFHSMFVHEEYAGYEDIIFCYFLTPIGQSILRENRKELGNGLDKFQPNDINNAKMLDIMVISPKDKSAVLQIYGEMKLNYRPEQIYAINDIIKKYV